MMTNINRFKTSLYILALLIALAPLSAAQSSSKSSPPANIHMDNEVWPGTEWTTAQPEEMGMDTLKLEEARDYALSGGGSGMVTRSGVQVMSWGNTSEKFDLKSTGKSIGVTALGLAILDGRLSLEDLAVDTYPGIGVPPDSNLDTGWLDEITIQHLATMTAGFDKSGGYTGLLFQPGTEWAYSDGGPNWLAETLTLAYREDLYTLLTRSVFTPLGIPESQLSWRDHIYRPDTIAGIKNREFGGISASVNAMARLGLLYLRDGRWAGGQQIMPESFVQAVRSGYTALMGLPEHDPVTYPNASEHYGLLWWNNSDGSMPNVPLDAYWAWGLYESLIVVIPSLDIVAVRASYNGWQDPDPWSSDYRIVEPFIEPIALSAVITAPLQQSRLWLPVMQSGPGT